MSSENKSYEKNNEQTNSLTNKDDNSIIEKKQNNKIPLVQQSLKTTHSNRKIIKSNQSKLCPSAEYISNNKEISYQNYPALTSKEKIETNRTSSFDAYIINTKNPNAKNSKYSKNQLISTESNFLEKEIEASIPSSTSSSAPSSFPSSYIPHFKKFSKSNIIADNSNGQKVLNLNGNPNNCDLEINENNIKNVRRNSIQTNELLSENYSSCSSPCHSPVDLNMSSLSALNKYSSNSISKNIENNLNENIVSNKNLRKGRNSSATNIANNIATCDKSVEVSINTKEKLDLINNNSSLKNYSNLPITSCSSFSPSCSLNNQSSSVLAKNFEKKNEIMQLNNQNASETDKSISLVQIDKNNSNSSPTPSLSKIQKSPSSSSSSRSSVPIQLSSPLNSNSNYSVQNEDYSLGVSNISFRARWQDLKDLVKHFVPYSSILHVEILFYPDGRSQGVGSIKVRGYEAAKSCIISLNGYLWLGRSLSVSIVSHPPNVQNQFLQQSQQNLFIQNSKPPNLESNFQHHHHYGNNNFYLYPDVFQLYNDYPLISGTSDYRPIPLTIPHTNNIQLSQNINNHFYRQEGNQLAMRNSLTQVPMPLLSQFKFQRQHELQLGQIPQQLVPNGYQFNHNINCIGQYDVTSSKNTFVTPNPEVGIQNSMVRNYLMSPIHSRSTLTSNLSSPIPIGDKVIFNNPDVSPVYGENNKYKNQTFYKVLNDNRNNQKKYYKNEIQRKKSFNQLNDSLLIENSKQNEENEGNKRITLRDKENSNENNKQRLNKTKESKTVFVEDKEKTDSELDDGNFKMHSVEKLDSSLLTENLNKLKEKKTNQINLNVNDIKKEKNDLINQNIDSIKKSKIEQINQVTHENGNNKANIIQENSNKSNLKETDVEKMKKKNTEEKSRHRGGGSIDKRKLFIGNIPYATQWQDLKDHFRKAGEIVRIDIVLTADGHSKGFAIALFSSEKNAENAVKMFNGTMYLGRKIIVRVDQYVSSNSSNKQEEVVSNSFEDGDKSNSLILSSNSEDKLNLKKEAKKCDSLKEVSDKKEDLKVENVCNPSINDVIKSEEYYNSEKNSNQPELSGSSINSHSNIVSRQNFDSSSSYDPLSRSSSKFNNQKIEVIKEKRQGQVKLNENVNRMGNEWVNLQYEHERIIPMPMNENMNRIPLNQLKFIPPVSLSPIPSSYLPSYFFYSPTTSSGSNEQFPYYPPFSSHQENNMAPSLIRPIQYPIQPTGYYTNNNIININYSNNPQQLKLQQQLQKQKQRQKQKQKQKQPILKRKNSQAKQIEFSETP